MNTPFSRLARFAATLSTGSLEVSLSTIYVKSDSPLSSPSLIAIALMDVGFVTVMEPVYYWEEAVGALPSSV